MDDSAAGHVHAKIMRHPDANDGKPYFRKRPIKGAQWVGDAIIYPDMIEVFAVSGEALGVAKDRAEALAMIDQRPPDVGAEEYRHEHYGTDDFTPGA